MIQASRDSHPHPSLLPLFLRGKGGICVGVMLPTIVFHELTRPVPSGLTGGFEGMRDWRKFCLQIRFYITKRGTERKVRPDDAHGQKEGFSGILFAEFVQLVDGFVGDQAIGVGGVRPIDGLIDVHVLGIRPNFTICQAVHNPPRMLPWTGRKKASVP
jgi:hypothetical protein